MAPHVQDPPPGLHQMICVALDVGKVLRIRVVPGITTARALVCGIMRPSAVEVRGIWCRVDTPRCSTAVATARRRCARRLRGFEKANQRRIHTQWFKAALPQLDWEAFLIMLGFVR